MARETNQKNPVQGGLSPALARHGGLSYIEIAAIDPARSAAFYESVVGWNIDRTDPDRPKFLDQTGHLLGRWRTDRAPAREPGLLPYIYVNRIRDAVERVATHGGEVVRAPYPEGDLLVATVRDPAGNLIGLWQKTTG